MHKVYAYTVNLAYEMTLQSTINLCVYFVLHALASVCARLHCGSGGHVLANIDEGLGFQIRDWDIRTLNSSENEQQRTLLFCFETVLGHQRPDVHGQVNGTEPNNGRISRRFSLPELQEGPACPEVTNHFLKGKKIFKFEIQWNSKVHINATFMERTVDITELVLDKFKGDIDQLVNYVFAKSKDIIDNKMLDGAHLGDIPLEAVKLDIFLSRQKNLKVPRIMYKLCEPSNGELTNQTRENLINACKVEIEEWNHKCGWEAYKYTEEECLRTDEENKMRAGLNRTFNPFPEGQNQSGGGRSYSGPIVPTPLKPNDEQVYNTEFIVYLNRSGKPPGKRHKRNAQEFDGCKIKEFDLRQDPVCGFVVGTIRNQSSCNSCWAVSAAAALTDRVCMAAKKNGAVAKLEHMTTVHAISAFRYNSDHFASARDVMECSSGEPQPQTCTLGGHPWSAWAYYSREGTVHEKCKPYPTSDLLNEMAREDWVEKCHHQCDQKTEGYGSLDFLKWRTLRTSSFDTNSYHKDVSKEDWTAIKMFAGSLYSVNVYKGANGADFEQTVIDEIRNNGSVVACYEIYDDFGKFNHDEKIPYAKRSEARKTGNHAVRLIGYGEMDCPAGSETINYWLVANSWGANWGDSGVFRIVRGKDECGIDSDISWGSIFFIF